MSRLNFQLERSCSITRARAGRFKTLHNEVLTPLFMPVGTHSAVRHIKTPDLLTAGSQILLTNTYHLLLKPGPEVFKHFGGIHPFMNWSRSVLTDSGGYQIFSLPNDRKISEEGAKFKSYVNGDIYLLSPELSIATQRAINSDIMMVLDICVPSTSEYSVALEAMDRTHRWAERSLKAREDSPQALFGIVQGACFRDLRKLSASALGSLPFDGMAIGGLAVGETKEEREEFTALTAELLDPHKPRYLMGVGTPLDLIEAVACGVDMFDCIIPTSLAEQGVGFTFQGTRKVIRGVYKFSQDPIEQDCPCEACSLYSRAYMHHLIKKNDPYGISLLALHNITFYHRLMAKIRESLLQGTFHSLYRQLQEDLSREDENFPMDPPKVKKKKGKIRELGAFKIRMSDLGFASVEDKNSGEIMHSHVPPDFESEKLYVEGCHLKDRLLEKTSKPLVLWDLGLGSGHNAMAALRLAEALNAEEELGRTLQIFSFEKDLCSFELAQLRADIFPHMRHKAPQEFIKNGKWTSVDQKIQWELIQGNYLDKFSQAPQAEVIFFDPFSSKTNPESWTFEVLKNIFDKSCRQTGVMASYSQSTAFRAALLAAGFYVARIKGVGPQAEGSLAYTQPNLNADFLNQEWFQRWQRSDRPHPMDIDPIKLDFFRSKIIDHPQFQR